LTRRLRLTAAKIWAQELRVYRKVFAAWLVCKCGLMR
jgi:hypothetical protein